MYEGGDSAPAASDSERFTRSDRVRRRFEYRRAQQVGRRVHTRSFVCLVSAGPEVRGRLGITVTKKVAHSAGRSRIKRVVREAFRRNRELFPEGCDVVMIAKAGATAVGYAEVCQELRSASRAFATAGMKARGEQL